jgi:hypothetical protein
MAIEAYRHAVADNYVKELIDFRRKASIDEASRIDEARLETQTAMARKMLHDGLDIKQVVKWSGLPEDEVRKLIN